MSLVTRWYISRLKSHPMMTNIGTACVLMATGDAMAQELEREHVLEEPPQKQPTTLRHRVSLKRYGTVNPNAAQTAAEMAFEKRKHQHDHSPKLQRQATEKEPEQENKQLPDFWLQLQDRITFAMDVIRAEVEYLDGYRTTTMIAWSAGIFTPMYVWIYRVWDRLMPQQTPTTVGLRVLFSFLLSIPINAGFFTYGTWVHHTMEWMAIQKEWKLELELLGVETDTVELHGNVVPYDWEMLQSSARLKLESELVRTVTDSAKVWIPINIANFTLVPPHLRPLVLLSCSLFWNVYLSLAQHRDLSIPDAEEEEKDSR